MRRLGALPEDQLVTTAVRWPLANCTVHPTGGGQCRASFLMDGAVVEAQWSADKPGMPDQADVWRVASAIEARLRTTIVARP